MKILSCILLFMAGIVCCQAQVPAFRFAFMSDIHISSASHNAEEDLVRSIRDINSMHDIAFVVITGDITDFGADVELKRAKELFDSLRVPYHIIPGNHDACWSESAGASFARVFGADKFSFTYNGIRFLGTACGPYVRMSDGHIPRNAVNWLDTTLKHIPAQQPIIFLNHYPQNEELDNWYEVTDRLKRKNTWAILCGHGHSNKAFNFEDIPGVMGRSNLRAKKAIGGYNLVDVRNDSIIFSERTPGVETKQPWTSIAINARHFDTTKVFKRPDYHINDLYPNVTKTWELSSAANIISTPAVAGDNVIVGNQEGEVVCLQLATGKKKWSYRASDGIFSSPAIQQNSVVMGVSDGSIICLDTRSGKLKWKATAAASVLGSPIISGDTVFIGTSAHTFLALALKDGATIWSYDGLEGFVASKPLLYNGSVIFGAWDNYLYSLNRKTGALNWKWTNGSKVRMFSPAACIPVASDGVVYIMAPDRNISAIDAVTGETLWRNNDTRIRESIGMSKDGKWIYGKTMQDTLAVYAASREKQSAAITLNIGFGYEHVPSMIKELDGLVYFGTRNGVVYCVNMDTKKTEWAYKIDNSMVNTVNLLDRHRLVAATMDGKVVLLTIR